jgi:hypothetical protein
LARIRTIKPDFFTSEDIVELSPVARLLYIALWCEADREGRLVWRPGTFKLRYFPGDNLNIDQPCKELLDRGLVVLYGQGYAYIPTFSDHQHVNPRESHSTLPEPDASTTREHASNPDVHTQVGRERKGKEGKTRDASPSMTGQFLRFWGAWPKSSRKQSRGECWELWRKQDLDQVSEPIIAHVEALKLSIDWRKESGAFIPAPLVYLRQKRWEGADLNTEPEKRMVV